MAAKPQSLLPACLEARHGHVTDAEPVGCMGSDGGNFGSSSKGCSSLPFPTGREEKPLQQPWTQRGRLHVEENRDSISFDSE